MPANSRWDLIQVFKGYLIRYTVQVENVGSQKVCAISIELFTARSFTTCTGTQLFYSANINATIITTFSSSSSSYYYFHKIATGIVLGLA